jgi:NAD(P)-dependent dehydrogenase (short-subunit alcohol dehydrogenase family)
MFKDSFGVFNKKTILVTGASSGIGQAIAKEIAKCGAVVLIHYHKNEDGAKATLGMIKKYSHGNVFQADLTKPFDVKELFLNIRHKHHGFIDFLVNNAGEAHPGDLDDMKTWDSQIKNILLSQVYTSNEFIKFNNTNNLRKIVNISSIYGNLESGNSDYFQYSAAKAAVNSFTLNLAKKYAPNILVNAVAPGYTLTPAWKGTPKEEFIDLAEKTLIRRFVQPEEIATMVVELLSNNAITGEIIRVDGGLHLYNQS